jgi:ornithine cyclodeaminase/alanine dehydrogenase-like protein (mu-crystallin family)
MATGVLSCGFPVSAYDINEEAAVEELARRGASVVVDTIEGVREEAGDLIRAEHAGAFGWEEATQLEEALVWTDKPGGMIVFKSVGHALWDLAAARTAFGS